MRFFKILCKHYNLCPYHISPTINPSSLPFILSFYSKFNIFIVHPSSFLFLFIAHRSTFIVPKVVHPSSFIVPFFVHRSSIILQRSRVHPSKGSSFQSPSSFQCSSLVTHRSSFQGSSFLLPTTYFLIWFFTLCHTNSLSISKFPLDWMIK